MSRDDGFPIADVDVRLLDDAKFRALWRRLRDPGGMYQATTLYLSVILASWSAGERVTLNEAVPTWADPYEGIVAELEAVGLIDADGRLPEHAWDGWFGPAHARREERREAGRRGGLARAAASRATAEPEHSRGEALPVRTVPSVPSGPTEPPEPRRARAVIAETTTNGHTAPSSPVDLRTCPTCGEEVDDRDRDTVEVINRRGQLAHREGSCPGLAVVAQ